jgi:hypothetical protein
MSQIFFAIGAGILSGAITALLGYTKSVGENFDPQKAYQTLIVGAIVGGVAGYLGVEYNTAEEYLESIGAITLIEYVKKSILKRVKLQWKSL